jgi:hypothetical protein
MKKILWIVGIGVALLGLGLYIFIKSADTPLPTHGRTGTEADELARKMEVAVHKTAWDSTRYVRWQFRTGTDYLWDKQDQRVAVVWGDTKVILHTPTRQGDAFVGGQLVSDSAEKAKLLKKAWAQFANDSFWLCAPMKAFDPGTTRSVVDMPDGSQGLLVTYRSGGVTPGDSYLWHLDDQYLPIAWQMWVSIIPVGGLTFTWEDWTPGDDGQPRIARTHEGSAFGVPIKGLSFPVFAEGEDPFATI